MLKKWWIMVLCALLLAGCGHEQTMETVADVWAEPAMAEPRQVQAELPEEAAEPMVESGEERVYLTRDYEIQIRTLEGGNLDATIRELTGFGREELTVIQTLRQEMPCYQFVWACAGEAGEQLGRGIILDDGQYHYCMTVLRNAEEAETCQVVWSHVFETFCLV